IDAKTLWALLVGFLPGVVAGAVLLLLGLILLAPEPNVPPPHEDNSPGDVAIQLSADFLSAAASQNLNGFGIPTPFGNLPLENVRAQPQSGDQLSVTGDVDFPLTGSRQVLVVMRPCVAASGRPAFVVTRVLLGDQPITDLVESAIQDKVNSSFSKFNFSIPHEHLSRIQTTPNALILIYTSSGSGGQPAC
ncbi:MAG TPA: hypothetical protein VFU69_17280, partial [Ktedonobacterales bacterium]|nr:hypothetical protein [Ktedonobacterales bacterium]